MSRYLFLTVLTLIAFNVWLVNFRRRRKEGDPLVLLPEERALLHVKVDDLASTSEGHLTTHRIHRQSNFWFLSRREDQTAHLKDVHSVSWQVRMNLWLLLVGALLVGLYSPLGILLVLYGLQTPVVAVGFQSHFLPATLFAKVGLGVSRSQIVFRSGQREYYPHLQRLYRVGQDAWSRARRQAAVGDEPAVAAEPTIVPLFEWTHLVWISIGIVLVAAHLQRAVTGHVVMDQPVFGALYLALPLAVTHLDGVRSGLWTALLTFLVVLAVKFPAGVLLGWALNDGSLHAGQALAIWLALVLVVAVGAFVRRFRFLPIEIAILIVWPVLLAGLDPGSIYAFRSVALVLFALAACRISIIAIPAAIESKWLRSFTSLLKDVVDVVWGPA